MEEKPGAFVVDGAGTVSEYQLGQHVGGTKLATQVAVLSNTVTDGQRTVVLSRAFKGATKAQYTFAADGDADLVPFMNAVGSTSTYQVSVL